MTQATVSPRTSAWTWLVLVLALGVALGSYRYFLPGSPGAAPAVVANRFTPTGVLIVHVGFAATALLVGPFQFIAAVRARWPRWHRRVGTLYVCCCLGGGLAGLTLALGTTAGPMATAGFGGLALAWLAATANAWRLARARDFARHRRWMIRSFALTFAAVTLRLYLPVAAVAHLDFVAAYQAISFLCWVPNLVVAELYLALARPAKAPAPSSLRPAQRGGGSARASPPPAASWRSPG